MTEERIIPASELTLLQRRTQNIYFKYLYLYFALCDYRMIYRK